MPNTELLGEWIREAKTGIRDNSQDIKALDAAFHEFKENDYAEHKLEFARFKTAVQTRNRVIWGLVSAVFVLSGLVIALLTFLKPQ